MGAAPALAEGTAGVEPASEAERATTARPEALASWTRRKDRRTKPGRRCESAGRELEAPPQEGWRKAEAMLRKREGEADEPRATT